ncbi:hypothetical protein SFRURICE_016997 [Spodoptera frugiperda]|nr:hypothetical protein SFRURICE_016997 [Spodoptera frugiperda]
MSTHNSVIPITNKIKVEPKNRIDKDIQKFVYPFNAVLTIVFCSKYTIRNDNIAPRVGKYCIIRLIGIIIALGLTGFRMYKILDSFNVKNSNDRIILFLSICLLALNVASFITTSIVNFMHGQDNALLIKIIQSIHKDVTFRSFNSSIIWNWITLTTIVFVDIFLYILKGTTISNLDTINSLSEIFFCIIDIDFVYTVRLQLLLVKYLKEWIDKVRSVDVVVDEDSYYTKMYETYKNILKAYGVFKKVSECLVLFRISTAFFRNLCRLQLLLCVLEKWKHLYSNSVEIPYLDLLTLLVAASAMVKVVLIVMIHCGYSEKFSIVLEDANVTCILRMKNVNCSKVEKQFCKNILRENETFSKMTACGLFYIDGRLPLSLLGLLTQYFVAELQFAFLRENT